MRADQLLVHRGQAASRSQAQRLLAGGARWLSRQGWKPLSKSDDLPEDATVELHDTAEAQFVSRGGLKLQGALAKANLSVAARLCLDVGQSTGGFTDCLLQNGAEHVLGIDVGRGQLHPRLANDSRVTCIEGLNARNVTHADLRQAIVDAEFTSKNIANNARGYWTNGQKQPFFEVLVGDVSFISQTLLIGALATLLGPDAQVLMLVKPQFELQPGQLGKGGIVKDASLFAVVEARIRQCYAEQGLRVNAYFESPIAGGDGNREFFVHATR